MVQPTSVCRIASHFLSKIHHQRPLSPRESQQLFNIITKSFRENLDQAHARPQQPLQKPLSAQAGTFAAVGSKQSLHPIDQHLKSILENPLFALRNVAPNSQLPMDTFMRHVASGTADLKLATTCLRLEHERLLKAMIHNEGSSQLQATSAGQQVLDWMWSSGILSSGAYLDDVEFLTILSKALKREKLEEYVWAWTMGSLKTAAAAKPVTSQQLKRASNALVCLIRSVQHTEQTLDAAYSSLVTIVNWLITVCSEDVVRARKICTKSIELMFTESIKSTTALSSSSPALFDAYVSTINRLGLKSRQLLSARLAIHHPSEPTADAAFGLLLTLKDDSNGGHYWLLNDEPTPVKSPASVRTLALETSSLLKEQGRSGDVARLVERLEPFYPQTAKAIAAEPTKAEKRLSETLSIDLLGQLGLA